MTRRLEEQGQINAVVGLGNPGKQYERTRHNAGFRVLDQLAEELSFTFQERKFRASWCAGTLGDRKLVLCKPLAYMNRSGEVVAEILGYFGIDASQALVVHDDLDLPLGRLRLVHRGGPGGHRGVSSIIDHLKTRDFPRLKLGIGRPLHEEPVETFVLRAPSGEEVAVFDEMISHGVEVVRSALALGLDVAMNRYNR